MWRLIPFTLAALILFPASHAAADQPSAGTGTVYLTPIAPPQVANHGGNLFVELSLMTVQTGVVSGLGTETLTAEVHPDGTSTFQAWQTVAATVDGRTGQIVARIVGQGVGGTDSGHITTVSASGGLAQFHGEGTFTGSDTSATYTLYYHFDP